MKKLKQKYHPNKPLKSNWQWKTVFKSKTVKIKGGDILPEESEVCAELDKLFEEIQKKEKRIATP